MSINVRLQSVYAGFIPLRHRAFARLLRSILHIRVLNKMGFLTEFTPYMIRYELYHGSAQAYISKYIVFQGSVRDTIIDDMRPLYELYDSVDELRKLPRYSYISSLTMFWQGLLFDEPVEGYIAIRYKTPLTKLDGDIKIDIISYGKEERRDISLGDVIAKCYREEVISTRNMKQMLRVMLYMTEYARQYTRPVELLRIVNAWSEKMVVIGRGPAPIAVVINRYGMAIKRFDAIASDARKFIEAPEEYKRDLREDKEFLSLLNKITPLIIPYRLQYLRPFFNEIRDEFFKRASDIIPVIDSSSLIAFDPKGLSRMMALVLATLFTSLERKYVDIIDGSRKVWSVIQKVRRLTM